MIEFCSKKRMLTSIILLGGLTLIVLIFESHWAFEASNYNHFGNYSNLQKNSSGSDPCLPDEEILVVESCHPCSKFEIVSETNKACFPTHFKETVKCSRSAKQFHRSCDRVEWLEEKKFWQFELLSFVVALTSSACVVLRQRILDQRHFKNLQRRLASTMGDLYLVASIEDGVRVSFESAICLFVYHNLSAPSSVKVHFLSQSFTGGLKIETHWLNYDVVTNTAIPLPVSLCTFPAFALSDRISCVAGLCAVLRQLVNSAGNECAHLLGFRQACLVACAEVSVWTKFCEVDLVNLAKSILSAHDVSETLPVELARLEAHMEQPIRVHNVGKFKDKDHVYAEGPMFLLTDLMIALPVYVVFLRFRCWRSNHLPLVSEWLTKITSERSLDDQFALFTFPSFPEPSHPLALPAISKQSLYKRDPTRYKPRSKIFTQQVDIDASLSQISSVQSVAYSKPIGLETQLREHFPLPQVPKSRLERKIQQLINLTKATLEVAQPGDLIVDFCSGSGHLGLILAHCLPESTVVLLDNKEKSLDRARQRIESLYMRNIFVVQANLDYFSGRFQVGVSLHACGLASDLVIHKCLSHRANFVVCPCCYGAIQSNHIIKYPQSEQYKNAGLSERGFVVLGHCADQEGCQQGESGMQAVDTDRCLLAKNYGYKVTLSKLIPPTCTTRNNLIVARI